MHLRNRLQDRFVIVTATTGVMLLVAGCASSAGSGTATSGGNPNGASKVTSTAKSSAPLVIGASVSLTGDFSDSGKGVQRGYQLWADTVNAKGGILGRKVTVKIVDDASSPTQVVTNYQNLINKDHVDLTFGPFSTLLTIPASQVAKRYGYAFLAPAGGGPDVFKQNLNNFFFVQPAPTTKSGDTFANYILSLPTSERPKTAAYAELDDPFSAPIAENIRAKFEAAGIQTVYKQVYPSETQDLSPVMAGDRGQEAGRHRRRHPKRGRLRPGEKPGAAEVQPEVHVPVQRRELPAGVSEQGRRRQYRRHHVGCGLVSGLEGQRQ